MKQRLINLWGLTPNSLVALEYRIEEPDDSFNILLFDVHRTLFSARNPGFYIELLERNSIVLSPDDGWYLCCTQGDERPVAADIESITEKELKHFYHLSENFVNVLKDMLND